MSERDEPWRGRTNTVWADGPRTPLEQDDEEPSLDSPLDEGAVPRRLRGGPAEGRSTATGRDERWRLSPADRTVAVYVLAATVWIVLGGAAADALADTVAVSLATVELAKGLLFVVVTAAVLRGALRRWKRETDHAATVAERAAHEVQEAELLRSRFLRNVSHELRTPLTNILGYTATMQAHLDTLYPDGLERCLDRLAVNTQRLERLVIDLLELELAPSDAALDLQPVRLDTLIATAVSRVDTTTHPTVMRAPGVTALLDPARTERIIEELVTNAVRHTPPGTRVGIWAVIKDDVVKIRVEDEGPGLDRRLAPVAFEPFTQGPATDEAASPGMGLGLALVRHNAQLQGGRVRYAPPPAGGARFVVELPRGGIRRD